MQQKVFKTRKSRLVLILIIIGFVTFLSLYGMSMIFIRLFGAGIFTERNSGKVLTYLEKRYDIKFPENAEEVKAARDGKGWDGTSSFIIKFTAKPSEVEKFIGTAVNSSIRHYRPEGNPKYPNKYVPDWWKKPIEKGERGWLSVIDNFVEDWSSELYICIDSSNDKKYVVYLHGPYTTQMDP